MAATPLDNSANETGSCSLYRLEPAMDYIGGDIGTEPLPAIDQEACCHLCEAQQLCNAFTYVAASRDCWLKMRRRMPRAVNQPTSLVSGHRNQLKRFVRLLGGSAASSVTAGLGRPAGFAHSSHLLTPRALATRASVQSYTGSWRAGGGVNSEVMKLQQERLSNLLLTSAAASWRGVLRGTSAVPNATWLSVSPPPPPPSKKKSSHSSPRGEQQSGGGGGLVWLYTPSEGFEKAEAVIRIGRARPPYAAWAAVRANATSTATATATPPLVEGDTSGNATAAAATPPLQEPSKEPVRIQIERRLLKSFAAERDRSSKNLVVPPRYLLARMTTVRSDGHALRYRPVPLRSSST